MPSVSPFPIMDYMPDLSLMKEARPAHHVGVEALSPVMIKRLETSLLFNGVILLSC